MSTPLANFFTKIGFEVDKSSLAALDKNLQVLESRIKRMSRSFQGMTDSAGMRSATRLASAEARRINAEARVMVQRTALARTEADIEKLRQQNLLQQSRNAALEMRNRTNRPTPSRTSSERSGGRGHRFGDALFTMQNFKAFAGIEALRRFTMQSFNVGNFQTSQRPQYEFLTGSAEGAQQQIDFVDKEVERLSLNLQDANTQYRQLLAATAKPLGIEQTQKLFTNFQNLSTMMGLSTDAQNRGMKAFAQMASKGQVMAEELKGQLAESLPGAVQIFADALTGGDVRKLFDDMEDGKVKIEELSKVIEHMGELTDPDLIARMLVTPQKAFERLNTSWQRFIMTVNEGGGLELMVTVLDGLSEIIKELTVIAPPFLKTIKSVFTQSFGYIKNFYDLLISVVNVFRSMLPDSLAGTIASLFWLFAMIARFLPVLNAAAAGTTKWAAALRFIGKAFKMAGWAAFLLLLDDLIVTLQGGDSVLGDMMKEGGWAGNISKVLVGIGRTIEMVLGSLIALLTLDGVYNSEVWEKYKKDMLDLFPFDKWMYQLKQFVSLLLSASKLAINPTNVFAYGELMDSYGKFRGSGQYFDEMLKYNPASSALAPKSIARQDMNGAPTYHIVNNVTLEGINDPKQIADHVTSQLNMKMIQAQSNYVMRSGASQ